MHVGAPPPLVTHLRNRQRTSTSTLSTSRRTTSNTMASYSAKSVQEAWDNHFSAFGGQDMEKNLLDYDENSVVTTVNQVSDTKEVFKGTEGVRTFFGRVFGALSDLSDLACPVILVDEGAKMVLVTWRCPASGFVDATDTFLFDDKTFKITQQNVIYKRSAGDV